MQHLITLTPPTLSPTHIKEKIICIRPHRERIFRVAYEKMGSKYLFHNYGHGGAGWTFLFGCVNESIRQFEELIAQHQTLNNKAITVVGAGCYGLLTALSLAHKGYMVRIIAKEIRDLTSHKATGFFFPRARSSSTPHEIATFQRLSIESYKIYQTIINGTHPFITHGAQLLPSYYSPDIDPGFAPYYTQGLMPYPQLRKVSFGYDKQYEVIEYKTIFMHAGMLMEALQHALTTTAIPIIQQEIATFDEISELIIFNCTGIGSQQLTQDRHIIPVQGHLISLQHQPSKQLQYLINVKVTASAPQGTPRDELIYFAPKEEGILGITFLRGQGSYTTNLHEFDRLLERSHFFFGT
jgi:D-amino-acid oxidase